MLQFYPVKLDRLCNLVTEFFGVFESIFYSKLFIKMGLYTVSHNYGNPYEKWNIFVARPHLWLQLGMVKPDIILSEMVLKLSTLNTLTYIVTYLLIS